MATHRIQPQCTSNICLHLYLAGSVTNSWSFLPTPSCLFLPFKPDLCTLLLNTLAPTGLGPLLHWPVLAASHGAFQMARILVPTPVTTDNSKTHKGKIRPKTSWFPTSSRPSLLGNCLCFPSHCSEKHSFPKRSPVFPSYCHRVK